MSSLTVGTRVKPSAYSLRDKWNYYLGLGDYTRKNRAREVYDMAAAERGTVTEVHAPSGELNRAACNTYTVKWDSGRTAQCMPYMVEPDKAV